MENVKTEMLAIPGARREGFELLESALREFAKDDALALTAFGGWLVGDPFFADQAAASVAVLSHVDLHMLDRLASAGSRLGKHNIRAPLVMTPEYIKSSCDVFPLELIEIQQLHAPLFGDDFFAGCAFQPREVRLQCERELKSELIQLRQGLLAAAGRHALLADLCHACAMRCVRILRGLLLLSGVDPAPQKAADLVHAAAETVGRDLVIVRRSVTSDDRSDFDEFQRIYAEIEALADHVDALSDE